MAWGADTLAGHGGSGTPATRRVVAVSAENLVASVEADGYPSPGFPLAFEASYFHTKPVLYDVDRDEKPDALVIDTDGRARWFGLYPQLEEASRENDLDVHAFQLPKLHVLRDWHTQVGGPEEEKEGAGRRAKFNTDSSYFGWQTSGAPAPPAPTGGGGSDFGMARGERQGRKLLQFEDGDSPDDGADAVDGVADGEAEAEGDPYDDPYGYGYGGEDFYGDQGPGFGYGYGLDYAEDDFYAGEDGWKRRGDGSASNFVAVDPHVLADPVAADVTGDGFKEVIVGASYFFDAALYSAESPPEAGVDPSRFMASALTAYDLHRRQTLWNLHLDLSVDGYQAPEP
uniref:Uncharacterized protein n=1 Tax=Phaeomonas parva TaxID=124430 RepID=A0A7S1UK98_9STRA